MHTDTSPASSDARAPKITRGEHVAADLVGAEQVRGGRRLADRAPARLQRIVRRDARREQRQHDEEHDDDQPGHRAATAHEPSQRALAGTRSRGAARTSRASVATVTI